MTQLILLALATFVSEDLTCLAAGGLIAAGKLSPVPGVLACLSGIFAGDLALYAAGRFVGRPLLRWRIFRKLLDQPKLDRAAQWLDARGAHVVMLSRFTPGLRLPTYVAAGLLKTRFWTFAGYFLLASFLWTPLLVAGAALFGQELVRSFVGHAPLAIATSAGVALVFHNQRRVPGCWRRITRWEFWPPWLAYAPVVPYILYLGVRHRCLTLFTAANPGILSGGFVGESKSSILAQLPHVPCFALVAAKLPAAMRVAAVQEFLQTPGLHYPVVLKPDVGQRGSGVVIARSEDETAAYLRAAAVDTIIQKYVEGVEFGIFYYRYPGESEGQLFSITRKLFPRVAGDGRSTIEELIRADPRAACLADIYISRLRRPACEIPRAGETVQIAELGSHCLGSIFLDGAHLRTDELRRAVDHVAKSHSGFYFGRFDVRAESDEALRAGRFQVLELNGVSAEATHIYDPSVSLFEAYRVIYRQWRIAFEIGTINRRYGAVPMGLWELARLVRIAGHESTSVAVD